MYSVGLECKRTFAFDDTLTKIPTKANERLHFTPALFLVLKSSWSRRALRDLSYYCSNTVVPQVKPTGAVSNVSLYM